MDKINIDELDFSNPQCPKGLLDIFNKAFIVEKMQAALSAIAVLEFQKGSKLTTAEKNSVLESIESSYDELMGNQLTSKFGEAIRKNF